MFVTQANPLIIMKFSKILVIFLLVWLFFVHFLSQTKLIRFLDPYERKIILFLQGLHNIDFPVAKRLMDILKQDLFQKGSRDYENPFDI